MVFRKQCYYLKHNQHMTREENITWSNKSWQFRYTQIVTHMSTCVSLKITIRQLMPRYRNHIYYVSKN